MAMAAPESTRVVFVKDPTALPQGVRHHEAIDALCKTHDLVMLLSHGNKYHFPRGWILPTNCKLVSYEVDTASIQSGLVLLRETLAAYGIGVHSRYLDDADPLPILLSSACLTMGAGTDVTFINKPTQYNAEPTAEPIEVPESDWDLLD